MRPAKRLRIWSCSAAFIATAPVAMMIIGSGFLTDLDITEDRIALSHLHAMVQAAKAFSTNDIKRVGDRIIKTLDAGTPAAIKADARHPVLPYADQGKTREGWRESFLPSVLAILIVATALLSCFLFTEYRLARWLRYFRRIALLHSNGRSSARAIGLGRLPLPLAELALQLNNMAESIDLRATDLERSVSDRAKLLHEIHHRVKNNFAIIASLLNLHKKTLLPMYQSDIRFLEEHVQATAVAYRVAYAAQDSSSVPAVQLIQEVIEALKDIAGCPPERILIMAKKDDALVGLDKAIALGLCIAYRLSPLLDEYAANADTANADTMHIAVRIDGTSIIIEFDGLAESVEVTPPLRGRLAEAYLHQLDGVFEWRSARSSILTVPLRH